MIPQGIISLGFRIHCKNNGLRTMGAEFIVKTMV
jgi:hypothetical protein